jgi:hypothetical protein
MPLRDKAKRFLRRVKEHGPLSSGGSTPDQSSVALPNAAEPSGTSTPAATAHVEPLPHGGPLSPHNLATTTPSIISRQSATLPVPTLVAAPPTTTDTILPNSTPEQPTSKHGIEHTSWAGLKTFAGVLKGSADVFGPLKSAVDAISECVQVYEVRTSIHLATDPT